MSLLGDWRRGYALRKLTGIFEGFGEPPQGEQYQRNTRAIGHWLDHLRTSSPLDITHALLKQMKDARRRGDVQRFNAQTVLLELMVDSNLALDLATYSAFVCAVSRRQAGS
ncbi:hypothetical protein DYL59_18050 [Pseudomonas kairouanensis]|uniref:Uncharacterized protein n=1 Tax=Pseudomonas kairouanensis TaxID=2293832 RepID=A0A4Z0ALP8_9PSED|nr:hypothetical protein [Pseudomonas kairouanensis]TFY87692.1 hypothetical protein DYL59_18050 [Pseudomonas kairouanensis]